MGGSGGGSYPRQHSLQVVGHIINREAQDRVSNASEVFISFSIVFPLRRVDFPVDLHHEPILGTGKIDEIRTDRMLPAELLPIKAMMSEPLPKDSLGWGCSPPKIPRRLTTPEAPGRGATVIVHHRVAS